ncbi:MAG: hypothetical protein ACXWC6_03165 [Ramlibacter sp.]
MNTEASGTRGPDQHHQQQEQHDSGGGPASTSTGQGAASALARFKSQREQRSQHSPGDASPASER